MSLCGFFFSRVDRLGAGVEVSSSVAGTMCAGTVGVRDGPGRSSRGISPGDFGGISDG